MAQKIREYTNEVAGTRPTEMGVDAFAAAGRRAGAFFNQVADTAYNVQATYGRNLGEGIQAAGRVAVDFAEHQEISHGSVAYAGLNDKLTKQWNDLAKNSDPNDPTIAAKFQKDVVEPELEKFQSSFLTEKGQTFAQSHINQLRSHLQEKANADMATLAARAVEVNVKQTANHLSNTAMTDPSSVPHLLTSVDTTISAMIDSSPNLKGAAAAKARSMVSEQMRENIVKSGAIGAIQSADNPEAVAAEWGKRYPQYINGPELKQLATIARQTQRLNRSQVQSDRVERDRLDKRDFNAGMNAVEVDTFDPETGERRLPPDYAQRIKALSLHPGAAQEPGRLKTMIDNMDMLRARIAKGEVAVTDPHVLSDLSSRLALGPGDPNYIKAQELATLNAKGQLSDSHYQKYMGYIKNSETDPAYRVAAHQFDEFVKTLKPSITHDNFMNPKGDPEGMQRYGQFQQYSREIFEKVYREKGAAEASRLFDANSPTYLGKILKYYQRDSKTGMKSFQTYMKNGVSLVPALQVPAGVTNEIMGISARKPGESAQDYLNRTRRK